MNTDYLGAAIALLSELRETQKDRLETGAKWIAQAVEADNLVWAFGAAHAAIITEELFYRAGGLACVSPLLLPGLTCASRPITLTSLERQDGVVETYLRDIPIEKGDVMIVHSVSGRNAAPVEMAIGAKEKGAKVIGLTSVRFSLSTEPRNRHGKRLLEVADLTIDNGAPPGDALVTIEGFPQPVSPISTVTGAALMNAMMAEACFLLKQRGIDPPVFKSANMEGGDEWNRALLERYRGRVWYL